MKAAVCTIISRNRLHLARVLMRSVAVHWPAAERHVLVLDDPTGYFDPAKEDFHVTVASDRILPRFAEFAFVNDVLGIACLLKPALMSHLLRETAADAVVYLDSDIRLYGDPSALSEALRAAPVLLTPHLLGPPPPTGPCTDVDFVRAGVFNAGMVSVARSSEAHQFLDWWLGAMTRQRSLNEFCCRDQLWLNLAPNYFPFVSTFRHPGFNVGYWNMLERSISRDHSGSYTAGDKPLVAFHYSMFDPFEPTYVTHRDDIRIASPNAAVDALLREYAREFERAQASTCLTWPYAFDCFTDGRRITAQQRRYFLLRFWGASGGSGSPFDPGFTAAQGRGLRSVYHYHHPIPQLYRKLRGTLPY